MSTSDGRSRSATVDRPPQRAREAARADEFEDGVSAKVGVHQRNPTVPVEGLRQPLVEFAEDFARRERQQGGALDASGQGLGAFGKEAVTDGAGDQKASRTPFAVDDTLDGEQHFGGALKLIDGHESR
jgi:hypothetical protein